MNNLEQDVISKMIDIYKPNGIDWMGSAITNINPLVYCHIKEGNTTLNNTALLTKMSQKKLIKIKYLDEDLYEEWRWLFYAINYSETHPSYAYSEMINELRIQTNQEIYGKKIKRLLQK